MARGAKWLAAYFLLAGVAEISTPFFSQTDSISAMHIVLVCAYGLGSSTLLLIGILTLARTRPRQAWRTIWIACLAYPFIRVILWLASLGTILWIILRDSPGDNRVLFVFPLGTLFVHLYGWAVHFVGCRYLQGILKQIGLTWLSHLMVALLILSYVASIPMVLLIFSSILVILPLVWNESAAWIWMWQIRLPLFSPTLTVCLMGTSSLLVGGFWILLTIAARRIPRELPSGSTVGLLSDPDTEDAPAVTMNSIHNDFYCAGCACNLRTQSVANRCPECGLEVKDSLERHARIARYRLTLIRAAALLIILICTLCGGALIFHKLDQPVLLRNTPIELWLADIAAGLAAVATVLFVCSRRVWRRRHAVRGILALILMAGVIAMQAAMTTDYYFTRTIWYREQAAPFVQALLILGLIMGAYGFVLNFSREMNAPRMKWWSHVAFWTAWLMFPIVALSACIDRTSGRDFPLLARSWPIFAGVAAGVMAIYWIGFAVYSGRADELKKA
jgi:hypothetical protein